jgi:catechol-2,3-dioxygenase
MGATTRDILGQAGSAEPASPGSYGLAPRGFRLPDATRLGRVRLQVSDLSRSLPFYQDAAGGYHHHLGTNTWAGHGATPPAEQDARLLEWTIELPDETSLSPVGESLKRGGYSIDAERSPAQLVARDPWGTQLRLVAAARQHNADVRDHRSYREGL